MNVEIIGHKNQILLEEIDLFNYQKEKTIDDNFCRKNSQSDVQMKFSCNYCRHVGIILVDKNKQPQLAQTG